MSVVTSIDVPPSLFQFSSSVQLLPITFFCLFIPHITHHSFGSLLNQCIFCSLVSSLSFNNSPIRLLFLHINIYHLFFFILLLTNVSFTLLDHHVYLTNLLFPSLSTAFSRFNRHINDVVIQRRRLSLIYYYATILTHLSLINHVLFMAQFCASGCISRNKHVEQVKCSL